MQVARVIIIVSDQTFEDQFVCLPDHHYIYIYIYISFVDCTLNRVAQKWQNDYFDLKYIIMIQISLLNAVATFKPIAN